jgi:hypothetical protein
MMNRMTSQTGLGQRQGDWLDAEDMCSRYKDSKGKQF